MKIPMPTVEQVRSLHCYAEYVVPREWEDHNGHVNFQYYLKLLDMAGDAMFAGLGIDKAYVEKTRRGFFELEHHIWYLSELHVGDQVSVHVRYYDRSEKRFHGGAFIVNLTRQELSCVFEFVSTSADLDARRTVPFEGAVAVRLDEIIRDHRALAWAEPRSGVIAA